MATISCTPADLAAASACFDCLNDKQAQSIRLYLLREIAGLSASTPAELAAAAACFDGMPKHAMDATEVYLACKAVEAL